MAIDGTYSNGPWDLEERLRKYNRALKYSQDGFLIGLTGYRATWNATDQVPQRAIDRGLIGRFGNIDPYLGGFTTRIGLTAGLDRGSRRATAYATHYDFGLTSNFTYFLSDPIAGDEVQQRDRRQVYGGSLAQDFATRVAGLPLILDHRRRHALRSYRQSWPLFQSAWRDQRHHPRRPGQPVQRCIVCLGRVAPDPTPAGRPRPARRSLRLFGEGGTPRKRLHRQ